jgi:HEAT repeat protein
LRAARADSSLSERESKSDGEAEDKGSFESTREDMANGIMSDVTEGVRGQYGHPPCDAKWMDSLVDSPYGSIFIAMIIAEDHCANLAPAVVDVLQHENPSVRGAAAWLVAQLGIREATQDLEAMVEDPDTGVAKEALAAMCALSEEHCKSIVRSIALSKREWPLRYAALQHAREKEIDFDIGELLELVNDENEDIVIQGLKMVSCERLTNEPFIGKILSFLNHADRWDEASWALSRCPSRAAKDQLLKLFAEKVEEIGESDEFTHLIEALTACAGNEGALMIEEYVLRHSSSSDTARIGASNVVKPLERAVHSLGLIGSASSRAALAHALEDPYYRVRKASIDAIERLGLQCEFRDDLQRLSEADNSEIIRSRSSEALTECRAAGGS